MQKYALLYGQRRGLNSALPQAKVEMTPPTYLYLICNSPVGRVLVEKYYSSPGGPGWTRTNVAVRRWVYSPLQLPLCDRPIFNWLARWDLNHTFGCTSPRPKPLDDRRIYKVRFLVRLTANRNSVLRHQSSTRPVYAALFKRWTLLILRPV